MIYILDACALTALLKKEKGADKILSLYKKAAQGEIQLVINKINLLEAYYDQYRSIGKSIADKTFKNVKESSIEIVSEISDELFEEAGRIKAVYKVSLADSIAIAQASVSGGELVTADHHEMDKVEQSEKNIKFFWIR